jgi:dTDP-4-amino-4,6-dideoxygalactose transaminase
MFQEWPIGRPPKELQRPELSQLDFEWSNPQEVIDYFEKKVAKFAGSKYGVAVDCCTNAIFLTLKYLNQPQEITIPTHTYISVPNYIKLAGYDVKFEEREWSGVYQLNPLDVWDGAGRWIEGMFQGEFMCLSFQFKKRLPIGRGGMILTDNEDAYKWLKKARYDGRDLTKSQDEDDIDMVGYHMYMTPEDAARGILLMDKISSVNNDTHSNNSYKNILENNVKF